MRTSYLVRAAGAALAIGALGMIMAASTSAGTTAPAAKVVIKGNSDENLRFVGPETVTVGDRLNVVNKTNPRKVGPHTFTLAKSNLLPKTGKQIKQCFSDKQSLCYRVAGAHEINFKTGEVKKPVVDPGLPGWDKMFGKAGDSWFAETDGERYGAEVTGAPGTYTYLCIIHPWMQGEIEVVLPPGA